jgi:hypothetical protein
MDAPNVTDSLGCRINDADAIARAHDLPPNLAGPHRLVEALRDLPFCGAGRYSVSLVVSLLMNEPGYRTPQ